MYLSARWVTVSPLCKSLTLDIFRKLGISSLIQTMMMTTYYFYAFFMQEDHTNDHPDDVANAVDDDLDFVITKMIMI